MGNDIQKKYQLIQIDFIPPAQKGKDSQMDLH